MTDQVKACKVLAWDPEQKQNVWQAAWFYGPKEIWTGNTNNVRAVVRFPGSLLLEEVGLESVELVEEEPLEPYPSPLELEEELRKTHNKLAQTDRQLAMLQEAQEFCENHWGCTREDYQKLRVILGVREPEMPPLETALD